MAKRFYKIKNLRKSAIALLAAAAITCTGFAAACSKKDDEDKKEELAQKSEDTQLLKNGNFEFFDYPTDERIEQGKAAYLIKTPDDWTRGGDSSNAMSGIIGTSDEQWAALTTEDLADKLDYNSDRTSTDDDYVNYNGMRSRDILYKDTYAALLNSADVAESYIKNQTYEAYFGIEEREGKYFIGETEVFKKAVAEGEDADPDYYFDSECTKSVRKQLIENPRTHYADGTEHDTNILMVHNYPTASTYNGIAQYYTSQTLTLEANTAAEISLWVKTSDLKFDKGYSQLGEQDRGAFIEIGQTVGGTEVDSFIVKAINTEKILKDNANDSAVTDNASNGWLKYTVYVNACDFAESTITIKLGLGQDEAYEKCTGYAFFDDVTVTKYYDLDAEGCSYSANKDKVVTRTLTSEDKVLYADREVRNGDSDRYSKNFHYFVDLASSATADNGYSPVEFKTENTRAGLTTEKKNDEYYAAANGLGSATAVRVETDGKDDYKLPKSLKDAIITDNDILGAFNANETAFAGSAYAAKLAGALSGDNGIDKLPGYSAGQNMLVMLSANGAAYTSTVNDPAFTLENGKYMIVSVWVKTSDMGGKTAATLKIYALDEDGEKIEKTAQSFNLDTTDVKTEFEGDKDLYNGWVQCFFFIENNSGDEKKFALDFSFGNTSIANTTFTSYNYGWAAFANLQTLTFADEDIYELGGTDGYLVKFAFDETEDENKGNAFAEASGTSDVTEGFAKPSTYTGVNGGSSAVADGVGANHDGKDTSLTAGLINRDSFKEYNDWQSIAAAFGNSDTDAVDAWNNVFGKDCYQPIVILDSIRAYTEKQSATAETYKNYYVEDENGSIIDYNGKKLRKVADGEEFSESTTYYSVARNYGYVGENASVSADSYKTVSVRVKVSEGAVAYVYLVDGNTRKVLGYSTPEYTFNYDEEGNVLNTEYSADMKESEHKAAIVYTLRKDGLYDGEGGVYANVYNLVKSYKYYKFESNKFFKDKEHTAEVLFDELVDGETYYFENGKVASHFLCNTDGKRIYEYDGESETYYYLADGKRSTAVKPFDTKYARYAGVNAEDTCYAVKVEPTGGKWQTVNFFIHAGNKEINYRLEIWSGKRDEAGDITKTPTGAVAFDYSAYSVTEDNYSTLIKEYEGSVIEAYKDLLIANNLFDRVESKNDNIAYYQKLIAELKESGDLAADADKAIAGFVAKYYTYTLYDSESYVPFNEETAKDGETGYNYKITDNEEALAYFKYLNGEENSVNVFADYSAVNKTVEMNTADDGKDDGDDSKDKKNDSWLLISSIVLVVALVFALLSLLLRDLWKKYRLKKGDKVQKDKNNKKRQRYIRKLHLVENAEETEDTTDEAEASEEPAVEEPVEAETSEEVPAEAETADEPEEVVEEAPVEEKVETETPAEDETAEETPAEDETEDKE